MRHQVYVRLLVDSHEFWAFTHNALAAGPFAGFAGLSRLLDKLCLFNFLTFAVFDWFNFRFIIINNLVLLIVLL